MYIEQVRSSAPSNSGHPQPATRVGGSTALSFTVILV